jgi:glucose-inhibited division protein A
MPVLRLQLLPQIWVQNFIGNNEFTEYCSDVMQPSGRIAKGQIVQIDALGGYSNSDRTAIQFKMLNKSKGPAMWSPRVQSDRMRFAEEWRMMLEGTPNLDFYQEMVKGLIIENGKVKIRTSLGLEIRSKVVLTNGTFLNGLIHIGEKNLEEEEQARVLRMELPKI